MKKIFPQSLLTEMYQMLFESITFMSIFFRFLYLTDGRVKKIQDSTITKIELNVALFVCLKYVNRVYFVVGNFIKSLCVFVFENITTSIYIYLFINTHQYYFICTIWYFFFSKFIIHLLVDDIWETTAWTFGILVWAVTGVRMFQRDRIINCAESMLDSETNNNNRSCSRDIIKVDGV